MRVTSNQRCTKNTCSNIVVYVLICRFLYETSACKITHSYNNNIKKIILSLTKVYCFLFDDDFSCTYVLQLQ